MQRSKRKLYISQLNKMSLRRKLLTMDYLTCVLCKLLPRFTISCGWEITRKIWYRSSEIVEWALDLLFSKKTEKGKSIKHEIIFSCRKNFVLHWKATHCLASREHSQDYLILGVYCPWALLQLCKLKIRSNNVK